MDALNIASQCVALLVITILYPISISLKFLAYLLRPIISIARSPPVKVVSEHAEQSTPADPRLVLPTRSFVHVHNRLYLALYDTDQAEIMARHELKFNFLVVPVHQTGAGPVANRANETGGCGEETESFNPSSLIEIFKFDEMACTLERKNPTMKLVFCTGAGLASQVRVAFLIGCHMIMSLGVGFEETNLSFKLFHGMFERFSPADAGGVTVENCWRALTRAKCLNWVDFRKVHHTLYVLSSHRILPVSTTRAQPRPAHSTPRRAQRDFYIRAR